MSVSEPLRSPQTAESPAKDWALALFSRSVLKQAKWDRILEFLQDRPGKTNCTSAHGVISFLLRQRGGRWYSADLDAAAVASIRHTRQFASNVHQLDGGTTPFAGDTFDQIVIVDFLEHIPHDREFVRELARILKPGGRLILNVPHLKPHSLLNRFRHSIGLTDEWHGHLRPGYSLPGLSERLQPYFED